MTLNAHGDLQSKGSMRQAHSLQHVDAALENGIDFIAADERMKNIPSVERSKSIVLDRPLDLLC